MFVDIIANTPTYGSYRNSSFQFQLHFLHINPQLFDPQSLSGVADYTV